MSASPPFRMLSVEDYEQIPNPPGGRYELHHGELVFVTFAVKSHKDIQRRLRKLLEPILESAGFVVDTEYPYCPAPEFEAWGADVACVLLTRHEAVDKWLSGSPELVIEVKSPSNTRAKLEDKARTTLAGSGAQQFWIVEPRSQTVAVYTHSGCVVYKRSGMIPLAPLHSARIAVASIFD